MAAVARSPGSALLEGVRDAIAFKLDALRRATHPPAGPVVVRSRAELVEVLRRQGPRKRPRTRPTPIRVSRSVEGRLARDYMRGVEVLRRLVRERVLPRVRQDSREVRADAIPHLKLGDLLIVYGTELQISKVATRAGRAQSAAHLKQHTRVTEALLGVRPELAEPWLEKAIRDFARENTRLIKDVGARFLKRVERDVRDGFERGLRVEEVAARIEARFVADEGAEVGIARRRARLIARDQLGSLSGFLTEKRHTELGIKAYRWRTSQDEAVRPSHRRRNNKRFVYGRPIEPQLAEQGLPVDKIDGHAGRPIQCRCTAEPDIESMLTDLEGGEAPAPAPPKRKPRRAPAPPRVRRPAPPPRPAPAPPPTFVPPAPVAVPPRPPAPVRPAPPISPLRAPLAPPTPPRVPPTAPSSRGSPGALAAMVAGTRQPDGTRSPGVTAWMPAPYLKRLRELGVEPREFDALAFSEALRLGDGVSMRSRVRDVITQYRLIDRDLSEDRVYQNRLNLDQRMVGARGSHSLSGQIKLAADTSDRLRRYARGERSYESVSAMKTLVHESLHGTSPITSNAYQGVGVLIEEVTTEVAARKVVREMHPNYANESRNARPEHFSIKDDEQYGSYQEHIDEVIKAVDVALGDGYFTSRGGREAVLPDLLERASFRFKQGSDTHADADAMRRAFVDVVLEVAEIADPAESARVRSELIIGLGDATMRLRIP
jgi:SPP1 gp7 family putative phage head morphogenesis protein